ncbi:uncharacterized protein LOC129267182 [Lytechinus pictus]|uniref:uncharacterized protein LOC129267182 n=1 Tax=Lytechinus pictus TaxID=7653 RepID=UPI0030BA18DB
MMSISTQAVLVLFLGVIISQSAPPTQIYIIDGKGVRYYFNNLSVTVKAGRQHDITCEAYGANPPSALEWHVPDDMAVVHQDQSDVIEDGSYISRKAVTITPSRKDHGKILSCIASHPQLQNERLRSVHLNVHVLPRDMLLFRIGGNQSHSRVLNVQEDTPTSITCKIIGSFPATELSFQLVGGTGRADNIPLRANISSKRSVLDDKLFDTEGTITIHPNIERHGKYIYCYASLEKHIVGFMFVKVIVYGPPEGIKITSPMDLYDGIEINVTCKAVNGYPAPHIHWYIGSRNLTEESSLNISENKAVRYDAESTLTLIPTSFDHGERLLCLAVQPTTLPGRSVNQSLVLNIKYHPVVSITARHLTSNKASGTTELALICEADANPPVNTFEWLCNETVVSNDSNNKALPQTIDATITSSVLVIQNPLSKYNFVYKCTAKSEYGSGSVIFNTVDLYLIPDAPSGIIVHQNQMKSSSLFVAWKSAPPNRLYITDGEGIFNHFINNLSLTVIAGQQHDITCEAYEAMPPAVLEWCLPDDMAVVHQDQSDVIQDSFYISQKAVRITLSRNDHGKILTCIASHPQLSKSLQCSVHLNVHVLPMSVLLFLTGSNQSQSTVFYVQDDSPTSITCKSIGSFPATELTFQLESGNGLAEIIIPNISSKTSILDDALFDTEGTVIIHPNIVHHGKYINCFALLEESLVEWVFAKVVVYGAPEGIKINFPLDLYDGTEINVTCKAANGYPAPHIHWYIGSRNLTTDSSLNISENKAGRYDAESTLTLIPTRFDHGKSLLCLAVQTTTLPARSVNQSLVLNITYHPAVSITARHLTSNKASGTTELVLICEADANPPAITFVWLCNETVVSNDPNYYNLTETLYEDATLRSSVLAIQNPLIMYHYVYNCTAVSEYGSGSAVLNSLYLYFISHPPSGFTIHQNQTKSSSLSVAWQPRFII